MFSSLFLDIHDVWEFYADTGKEMIFASSAIDSGHTLFSPQLLIDKIQGWHYALK